MNNSYVNPRSNRQGNCRRSMDPSIICHFYYYIVELGASSLSNFDCESPLESVGQYFTDEDRNANDNNDNSVIT